MDREKLTAILDELATFLDMLGENPFKVKAHQNAARIVEAYTGDIKADVQSGTIRQVKGIGPALYEKMKEFFETSQIAEHELLKKKIPQGVLDLLKIPGLGPKRVRTIYDELKVNSIGELEYACRENRLVKLDGFGLKTQEKILKNIEFLKKYQQNFLYSDAILEAQMVVGLLNKFKAVLKIDICGSLRRKKEIIKDIDILVATLEPEVVTKKFLALPNIDHVTGSGETKTSVILKSGIACDLRIVTEKEYPYALLYFTGSKEHNTLLRGLAKDKGYKLNEYGLYDGNKLLFCENEQQIYRMLGLAYIEPELRENIGEIELARKKELPQLVVKENIKGVFHCHTTDSDGTNSLEEMVSAAEKLGYEYIGISDHSASSAGYANGMKEERVLEQFEKINQLQKKYKIKIFKGIESDILADGELDYDEKILQKFDFVIGSIHSGFTYDEKKMTQRVIKAIKNPYLDFLGHPTGRLLLAREGFAINMHEVIDAAVKHKVVIEMNSHPQRLDLDWRLGPYLKKKGGKVSINPDAHSIAGLKDVEYGIGIARKAGFTKDNIINTLPANKVLSVLRRAKEK